MKNQSPLCASTMSLRLSEPAQSSHRHQHEADGDLVGDHLRRRTQRAEKGVFRVAGPARNDDPVDAEGRNGEEIEDADIEIGEHQMAVERDHRPAHQPEGEGDHGRQHEERAVRACRYDGLLEEAFDAVGKRLQQAERPDHVGPLAKLDRRPDLALEIGNEREHQHERDHDGEDVPDGKEQRVEIHAPDAGFSHRSPSSRRPRQRRRRIRPWSRMRG